MNVTVNNVCITTYYVTRTPFFSKEKKKKNVHGKRAYHIYKEYSCEKGLIFGGIRIYEWCVELSSILVDNEQ